MLKIGDEVIYIKHDAYLRGKLGKVIEVCPEDKEDAGVEFYDEINGHNCNGNGRNGYCWYVNSKDLEKTKKDVETCKKCKSEEFCTENETSCFVPEPMEFEPKYNYSSLKKVLKDAELQSSKGKGLERHANENKYEEQVICVVQRLLKDHPFGGHAYQIIKKTIEAGRLYKIKGKEAAYQEILGAINYAAAMCILIKED